MSAAIDHRTKTSTAVKDYPIHWNARLAEYGTHLVSATWASSPAGLTIGAGAYAPTLSADGFTATVWLSGGTAGVTYTVTCHGTDSNTPPREDDLSFTITIEPALPAGAGDEEGEILTFDGNTWVPRRFWIIPDIDLSGAVDATATIATLLASARDGACIYIPDGNVRVGTGYGTNTLFTLDRGMTLTGPEREFKMGSHVIFQKVAGAQFKQYHTGRVFQLEQQATLANVEIFDATQTVTGTPSARDWMIYVHGLGASVVNISMPNPYQAIGLFTNGGLIKHVWFYPLAWGIWHGANGDVSRVEDVNMNPGMMAYEFAQIAPDVSLQTWVQANCVAYVIDGADAFNLLRCNAYGCNIGLLVQDFDANGIGAAGNLTDCGFDTVNVAVDIVSGLNFVGLALKSLTTAVNTGGVGIKFRDSAVPGSYFARPRVRAYDLTVRGNPGVGRAIWMVSGSYGVCSINEGYFSDVTAPAAHVFNDSTDAVVKLNSVAMPTAAVRTAGIGAIVDINNFFGSDFGGTNRKPQLFGAGSDGDLTISSGTTTLQQQQEFANVTLTGTATLETRQFRLYVADTLDLRSAQAKAIVAGVSGDGGDASGATGGTVGAGALGDWPLGNAGRLGGAGAGATATTGSGTQGSAAGNQTFSYGAGSGLSPKGGDAGGGNTGGASRAAPTLTNSRVAPHLPNEHPMPGGSTYTFGGLPGHGGNAGAGDGANAGGGGGGGPTGAGVIEIYARRVLIGASTPDGVIFAGGGKGGKGGNGAAGNAGGGGGAPGAGGGLIFVFYEELVDLGIVGTAPLSAPGGTGGAGGNGVGTGQGADGAPGGDGGQIVCVNVSKGARARTVGGAGGAGGARSGTTGGTAGAAGQCQAGFV